MDQDSKTLGHAPTAERAKLRRHDDEAFMVVLHDFVIEAAQLLQDRHCEDVLVFDVRGMSQLTDYIIIATGTSDRQIKSLGSELKALAKQRDIARMGDHDAEDSSWLVVDLVDVVVHLFEAATREHYDLEMMWDDAPKVDISRPAPRK
jgi:ribosome-associated protein